MVRAGPPSTYSSPPAPLVAILLSTFNGEHYLPDQLASFAAQSHTNWRLYWRDDGSSDGTVRVMTAFARGSGRCMIHPRGTRLQATGSFFTLLHIALDGPAEFFAFSDQDDVWLPEKLAHGVTALSALPPDHPGLYFCARTLVDATLTPIGHILAPCRPPGFPTALTQNLAPGCCMMLNRAAARLIDAAPVPEGTWHDWWSYIVVAASGGKVIAGNTPDILYRQHRDNLIGEPLGFWHRARCAARRGRSPFMTVFWRQIAALQSGSVPLAANVRETLAIIVRSRHGGALARFTPLCLPGFRRQAWAENVLFRLWFLLG
jgi:glycosyltransferase involved in cell wall biosynthesis